MFHTKTWGTVSSNAELHMLNRAERTRKEFERRESSKRKYPRCQTLRK